MSGVHSGQEAVIPTELVERLEAASVGSRVLDVAIWDALGGWSVNSPPAYTTSLDAALSLAGRLLPELFWALGFLPESEDAAWEEHHQNYAALHPYLHVSDRRDAVGYGATAPLALCAAVLKATTENTVGTETQSVGVNP